MSAVSSAADFFDEDDPSSVWIVDLDGVMWLGARDFPYVARLVAGAVADGHSVCFATNNAYDSKAAIAARLRPLALEGLPIFTAGDAVARMLDPGDSVWCLGGPGLQEALDERGVRIARELSAPMSACVVGFEYVLTHSELYDAARAAEVAGLLLGVSDDPYHMGPDGPCLGGGAIVAAIAYASGTTATFCGKPFPPMVECLSEFLAGRGAVVIGDSDERDGALAASLEAKYFRVVEEWRSQGPGPGEPM